MPFTLSHAAAALPLHHVLRGATVLPALVIGCFIPDIPYFLPDPLFDINAHRLPGLVLFGMPCGYLLYVLWQRVFSRPGLALLPQRYAALFVESLPRPASRGWSIVLSLFIGAASHIVWDAFTHRRGAVVQAVPALAQPMLQLGGYGLTPYALLQHGSTLIGLLWLVLYVRRRLREDAFGTAQAAAELSLARRLGLITTMTIVAAIMVWAAFGWSAAPLSAYNVVCRSISSAAVVATVYALGWHTWYRCRHSPGRAGA